MTHMKTIRFTNGIEPSVAEVLSPFSGQRARVHRARMSGSARKIALFPGGNGQLMKVPQLGYAFETMAFGVCGIASFALILMLLVKAS
jgi:hypothetical protein